MKLLDVAKNILDASVFDEIVLVGLTHPRFERHRIMLNQPAILNNKEYCLGYRMKDEMNYVYSVPVNKRKQILAGILYGYKLLYPDIRLFVLLVDMAGFNQLHSFSAPEIYGESCLIEPNCMIAQGNGCDWFEI